MENEVASIAQSARKNLILKILYWIVVYVLFVLTEFSVHGMTNIFPLYSYALCLAASLINAEILIPQFLFKKKYLIYVLLVIFCIYIFSIAKLLVIGWVGELSYPLVKIYLYFPTIVMVGVTMSVRIASEWSKIQNKILQTEHSLLNSNLSSLRTQLNPHFFFNSINNIYHLIDVDKDEAKSAMIKMSNLLRFQMEELKGDHITLAKEIKFLQDYIEFESLRLRGEAGVEFTHEQADNSKLIPPLLLMPFVENAFKHLHRIGNSKIKIELFTTPSGIHFNCINSKQMSLLAKGSSGIGLKNVMARLDLIYGGKHYINIDEQGTEFQVKLILPC